MADDFLNYDRLVESALRDVVRKALAYAADQGLRGANHFYVSFLTGYHGVEISPRLLAKHGDEMTIVLQNQFWGLEVFDDAFEVTLSFAGAQERLRVPLAAITAFTDPSVEFGLQFKTIDGVPRAVTASDGAQAEGIEEARADQAPAKAEAENRSKVVALDTFRGKK